MKRILIFMILFVFSGQIIFSQELISPGKYAVYFKDKKGTPYSIERPEEFLSVKALERRKKNNIEITEQDLPVNPEYIKALKDIGVRVIEVSKWLNCAIIETSDSEKIEKISQLSFVTQKRYTQGKKEKSKPVKFENFKVKYPENPQLKYNYGASIMQNKITKVHILHSLGFDGEGITMAILDGGFKNVNTLPAFDSVWAEKRILGYHNFVTGEDSTFFRFRGTHGTNVFSTIAGNIPGQLIGTAPKAKFYLFITEDPDSETQIEEYNYVCACEIADSLGVDMIHSSLGYSDFDEDLNSYTYDDMNGNFAVSTIGADIAASKGIVVTVSAGNEGDNLWKYITAPSDGDSVLCVGATTWLGTIASFSSRGPSSDGRVKPDICAIGVADIVQQVNGRIGSASGTSFSGPTAAGAIASLFSAFPEAKADDIRKAVRATATKANNPDNDFGYGILDVYKAYVYLKNIYGKSEEN